MEVYLIVEEGYYSDSVDIMSINASIEGATKFVENYLEGLKGSSWHEPMEKREINFEWLGLKSNLVALWENNAKSIKILRYTVGC